MARQKTVFNNYDCAQKWAQQTQEYGRNQGDTFYFEGKVIYSYGKHFIAGIVCANENDQQCFLISTHNYSMATTKHINSVWRATRARQHFMFNCALNAFARETSVGVAICFDSVLAYYQTQIDNTWKQFKKGWKRNRLWRINNIVEQNETADEFIAFFGLNTRLKLAPEVIRYIIEVKMGIADEQSVE